MTLQEMPALVRALSEGVLTLTLNRPPAHALDLNLIEALHGALERAAADPHVRVVVLASSGHIFCAGHDLREIARHRDDPDGGRFYLRRLFEPLRGGDDRTGRRPAAHHRGGGRHRHRRGLPAGRRLRHRLRVGPRQLPAARGAEWRVLLDPAGRRLARGAPARRRWKWPSRARRSTPRPRCASGWSNRVLPPGALPGAALDFARRLAARTPAAIARGKQVFAAQIGRPLAEAYALASDAMIARFLDPAADAALERYRPAGGRRD
ncbi:MAG: hypothetical protein KatS3mg118_2165 [Paracoccaceae bacterium]|nr:MAG: hypothetical protein KatS3mg118_2165 [Paracoccaceae bacterium]